MRVRMKVTLSGTRDGQECPPRGQLVNQPDDEAAHLLAGGLAEKPKDDVPQVEEATAPDAETSAPSRRKPSARRSAAV
ncbi:hypothetical protein ACFC09_32130 [Streptomyces sp. NPDC056161]|uniref:hypothetical protein n=1 Tax=Streptomyces sp. NPDC056161 TaxID=3345732 RepID=UPI0035D8711D